MGLGDDNLGDEERDDMFKALLPSTSKLSSALYGSVVMARLLERATEEQRLAIADQLKGEVFYLSTHASGNRVVQKIVELLPEPAQLRFVGELCGRVIECMESMHGNHVVQMCVKQLPPTSIGFILDSILAS